VGGGLALIGLLLAGGFAAMVVLPRPAPAPAPEAARPINDLTRVLVASQVELARNKLDEKSYRAAATRAEQALKLDPQSDEARQVLAKAQDALKRLEAAAEQTRAALAAGDNEKAAGGLWTLLSLDPRYEGIDSFVTPLNSVFRDQSGQARQLMIEARASAERAKASGLPGFASAASAGTEGDALLGKKEYAAAAARFLDARDEYDRARRSVN
jgi:tetratricopeptide (TPR) repeat protein